MNTRTVLTASAVISLVFALASLLIPTTIGPMYGFGTGPTEVLLGRYFGVALLGIGLINWFARNMDYASLRPILLGNLIGDAAGFVLSLMGTLAGTLTSLGWLSVALYLLLALGFGYLYFMGQPVSIRQRA